MYLYKQKYGRRRAAPMNNTLPVCVAVDCNNKKIFSRGLCQPHYTRLNKYGDYTVVKRINHGLPRTTEYSAWNSMISRCNGVGSRGKKYYLGRGIKVCDRWRGPYGYVNFFADMGKKPHPKLELDRIDNDGNYEPGNCRWATRRQQVNNSSRVIMITIGGVTQNISEWCRQIGMSQSTYRSRRMIGLTPEQTITIPKKSNKPLKDYVAA